ncbi:MAG: hypothetical protein C0490_00105 [Marivirga sp.]|nr:hypothetical protein [Marivirga sp.]
MKRLNFLLPLFVGFLLLAGCAKKDKVISSIRYPLPTPDSIPLVFLPGIVSIDGLDFNAAFSRDGNTFYFSRSKNGKYVILESNRDGDNWTLPRQALPFDTLYSNADPFITADSSIYFISTRPRDATDTTDDFDIYRIRREDKKWTTPEYLDGVNSDSTEYYVSVATSGNIYFASYRDGNLDLFMSEFKNGKFSTPTNMGSIVNSSSGEHDPFIAPDESFLVFNSDKPGGYGEADLYISRKKDGVWQKPVNMGNTINTAAYEYCSNMSPDGKFFFYSSEYQVKWVDSSVLSKY